MAAKKKTAPTDYDHTIALMASEQFAHGECSIAEAVQLSRDIVAEVIRTSGQTPPDPPDHDVITENLQAAIDAAADGAVLWVAPTLVEPGPISIPKTLTLVVDGNVTHPALNGGLTVTGTHVRITGFDIRKTQQRDDIVVLEGADIALTSCRILGDPVLGNKRGVRANAPDITLDNCEIDYCFAPGQDSQAVCGWDNTHRLTLTNCILRAASENVMIGGSDCADQSRQPTDFAMTGCTLTKRPEWRNAGLSVKNIFELKNCIGATVTGNVFEDCWADGQAGYAIVFTPRNQSGSNPFANVTDVDFQQNTIRHVCSAFNLLGTDYPNPSGVMTRIQILGNVIEDLDCVAYGKPSEPGSNKAIQIGDGPTDVAISNNHFSDGKHVGYALYFYGKPCDKVEVIGNAFPTGSYGTVGGDGTAAGQPSWDHYVQDGIYTGNTP